MSGSQPKPAILQAVLDFNAGRKAKLVRLKLERMSQDVFSFFRGADHLLADDWAGLKPPDVGPAILQCGDLHLENFGAYQTDEGDFLYDINDFDEALVAPCSLDLVRCTASILVAGESWGLSPVDALGMALLFIDRYRAAVTSPPHLHAGAEAAPHTGRGPIWELLGEAAQTTQVALLNHNTEMGKRGQRQIKRSEAKHPPVSAKRVEALAAALKTYGESKPNPDAYRLLDATARIAGTGSLGVRRYLVLIAGGGTAETSRLLDIKEEFPPSLLACTDAPQPEAHGNDSLRAVEAQRVLQAKPAAGLDVLMVDGRAYRMREMIPDDNRTSLGRFQKKPIKLRQAIDVAGQLTGWSHLRGVQHRHATDRTGTLGEWAHSSSLDAVLVAAARYAARTLTDFHQFCAALADPKALPKELRFETASKSAT
ncbi:MAG: DUF2252 family protein [Isosphaeraceae bacterium]|nr:DUF2252 family protein [Isosphaeraceae bacterium]